MTHSVHTSAYELLPFEEGGNRRKNLSSSCDCISTFQVEVEDFDNEIFVLSVEARDKAANLDTGFRVFKCEDSFMNDVYFAPSELKQEDLFSQIENIKDGTSDLSLLFGCMLDWGAGSTPKSSS